MRLKAVVNIYLKEGVLDPQGKVVKHALQSLGFNDVSDVRVGKQIIIKLEAKNKKDALLEVKKMSETLLANIVIEDYDIKIIE